jgi:hypothetical protein
MKILPDISPRGMTMRQTAAFWGVSYQTFRKLVREGAVPPPMEVPGLGRKLFDRELQEEAFARYRKGAA